MPSNRTTATPPVKPGSACATTVTRRGLNPHCLVRSIAKATFASDSTSIPLDIPMANRPCTARRPQATRLIKKGTAKRPPSLPVAIISKPIKRNTDTCSKTPIDHRRKNTLAEMDWRPKTRGSTNPPIKSSGIMQTTQTTLKKSNEVTSARHHSLAFEKTDRGRSAKYAAEEANTIVPTPPIAFSLDFSQRI